MPSKPSKQKSIWVYIKLDGEGFANPTEFDLRYTLEDAIEERGIGKFEGAGSGGGWMDISFGVEDIEATYLALVALTNLLVEYNVPDEFVRFKVVQRTEEVCDSLPEFQKGDCLSYRFEDGDFGAAIILKYGHAGINSATKQDMQSGMPPVPGEAVETLLGILDYKNEYPPEPPIFEQHNWLVGTHESRRGQPFLIWVHCFGGIEVKVVHQVSLKESVFKDCNFHLSWELIPEYFIREKYRENKELNPYESAREFRRENRPKFVEGDCLSYRFEDGDFGAAIVLKRSDDGFSPDEMLLGILDYKQASRPHLAVFESRRWLLAKHEWCKGLPYLVWAQYCWSPDCKGIDAQFIERISLQNDDPMATQLCLFWEEIPEFVLFELGQ